MPAVQRVPAQKPIGKQTLVGIAPITIEKRATTAEPIQKLAPAEPVQKLAAAEPIQKPAPAEPVQKLAAAEPIPRPAPSEPIQSSPGVPGYAIAYTPKDHPGTPAVVIAPEAQSSPDHQPPERRREFSQTVPSLVRSAPTASVAPLPPPVAVDDFNPYAPKKTKGKVVGWTLAGLALLLLSVAFVRSFSSASHQSSAQSAVRIDVMPTAPPVAAAPTPAPAEEALTAQPTATPATAKEPGSPAIASRRASEPSPAKAKVKGKVKAEPAVATRPATRTPTSEPSPSPTRPAGKGVIVRDAPF